MSTRLTDLERIDRTITGEQLREDITQLAQRLGWKVAHFRKAQVGSRWMTPVAADGKGWPDLVLVRHRLIAIECKGQLESVKPEQVEWLDVLRDAGVVALVARPSDWRHGRVERLLRRS